jgi:hypothetical protein
MGNWGREALCPKTHSWSGKTQRENETSGCTVPARSYPATLLPWRGQVHGWGSLCMAATRCPALFSRERCCKIPAWQPDCISLISQLSYSSWELFSVTSLLRLPIHTLHHTDWPGLPFHWENGICKNGTHLTFTNTFVLVSSALVPKGLLFIVQSTHLHPRCHHVSLLFTLQQFSKCALGTHRWPGTLLESMWSELFSSRF